MTDRNEKVWCADCGGRFTEEETANKWGCPSCGSQGVPCGTDQDVTVEVNWHELRILTIWAENHAHRCETENPKMPRTVMAIARRLQQQHPTLTPLTLAAEIAELPQKVEGIVGPIETHGIGKPQPILVNGPGAVGHSKSL